MKSKFVFLCARFILLIVVLLPKESLSLVYIDINAPVLRQFPIAIAELISLDGSSVSKEGEEPENNLLGNGTKTLIEDLKLTGLFDVLDPVMFLEDPSKSGIKREEINFDDWTIIGAEGLVKGGFKVRDDGLLEVEMRLFDTYQGQLIIGKRYIGTDDDLQRMMHRFANEILLKFTGERGIFGSKISYIQDDRGYKEVFVMDHDGSDKIQITRDYSIATSPSWSPDGMKIAYTTYKSGNPDLVVNDFVKRDVFTLSRKRGLNLGAEWSYNNGKIALSMSSGNNSDIYIIDSETGKVIKRLTTYWGIDVSPTWSPDNDKIAFTSDRAGNPNIYIADVEGGEPKRLTFNGKYNSSPAWSPDGNRIAYCGQTEDKNFNIFTINTDGTDTEQLTSGSKNNENPTWSPDGRQIAFTSNRNGSYDIYVMNADGGNIRQLTTSKGNATSPAWSPRLE